MRYRWMVPEIALTLILLFTSCTRPSVPVSPAEVVSEPAVTTATKADLVKSLENLRDSMLQKIDSDVDVTAIAFTDVKAYWRAKRWADILRVPLRIIEDTINTYKKIQDLPGIIRETNGLLAASEAAWQAGSIFMMVQDLRQVGGQLQVALDGPAYTSSIKNMLDAADATYVPPIDKNWRENYQKVIENHLYGVDENKPLVIPRKSTTVDRKNIGTASGALEVSSAIVREFNDLIADIKSRELPQDFPVAKVVNQLKSLEMQVIRSRSWSADDISYETYLRDGAKYILQKAETSLGSVGSRYTFFGQVARNLNKKLEIEATVEVSKAFRSSANALLIYSASYKTEGAADKTRVVQKAIVVEELTLKTFSKVFYPKAEEEFYMLPQEMLFALPGELSNLWMIADDTDQYLRHLMNVGTVSVPTPAPTVQVVDSLGDVGKDTSIAFNKIGNPAISYSDATNQDLKFAEWDGKSWHIQTVDAVGSVGTASSLAFDPAGNPAIAYYDSGNKNLKYAHWNGATWNVVTVNQAYWSYKNSLAFDASGKPVIAYYDYPACDLKYKTYLDGIRWNVETVYHDGLGSGWGRTTSLALDLLGRPAIAFRHPKLGLRYVAWNGSTWAVETIDGGYGTGAGASLRFDSLGNPSIAYGWQGSNEGPVELKFARFNGKSWSVQTVESNGQNPSLSFDSLGNPAVSYYLGASGGLKYAYWDGLGWKVKTVDSVGDVGQSSSLAFDNNGIAVISYYDITNGDLKIAWLPGVIKSQNKR